MHQVESRRPMSADWTLARSVRWHWPRQYACVCFVGPIIVWCRMVSDQCVFSYWLSMSARESSATRILFSQDSAVGPCLLNIYGWRLQAISGNVNLRPWCKIFSPMPGTGVAFVVNELSCLRRVHAMSIAWWFFCRSIIGGAILRQCGFECTSSGVIKCFKTDSHSQVHFVWNLNGCELWYSQ